MPPAGSLPIQSIPAAERYFYGPTYIYISDPTIGVTVDITVRNSFDGGEIFIDGNSVPSGGTVPLTINQLHVLEAFDQDWPDSNNYHRVFQKWIDPDNNPIFQNPISINVNQPGTYTADFLRRFDFQIGNNFIDGGSGGTIKVNGQPQPAPYLVQILEGTSIQIEAPPQNQTVNGQVVGYHFLKWSDGSTLNPRTFLPDDHTSITAEYKGHLVSTTSTATAYNNSRKVAVDHIGGWHAVYEDNGQIYYLRSTDTGATWLPEAPVSSGVYIYRVVAGGFVESRKMMLRR